MSISDEIRSLATGGMKTAEIARRLGIRYQHAYNVLRSDGLQSPSPRTGATRALTRTKPPLLIDELLRAGFALSGRWVLSDQGALSVDRPLPKGVGVYAFAKSGIVTYVGVATMGLAKRLYFYAKPGSTQRTSQRINGVIRAELREAVIEIYSASPNDLHWNGLPVHASAGLELGLIKKFALPWNLRSAS